MMEDEEQEELRCTGSDVEIEEYTDTEESPYVAYQSGGDKLFDADREDWQRLRFLLTLVSVAVSITVLVITYPLYFESVGAVSSAYTGSLAVVNPDWDILYARLASPHIPKARARPGRVRHARNAEIVRRVNAESPKRPDLALSVSASR